jgi:integrase/recombinase XerD
MQRSEPANKGKHYPPEPLTHDEAQTLLDSIKGNGPLALRNRALLALLWRSGARISEALALKPADVDMQAGIVNVRKGKGRKARVVVFDSLAAAHLSAWMTARSALGLNGRQPLFCSVSTGPTRKPGQPIDSAYVRRLLPKVAARAGIDKRVHPHGMRHTHAGELANSRLPLTHIAAQLGHASVATTDAYIAKLNPTERIDAMRAAGFTLER